MNTVRSEHADETASLLTNARSLLQQGDLPGARRKALEALTLDDQNSDALYMLAVAERYLDDQDAARAALQKLLAIKPHYGRAHQELGHLQRSIGSAPDALTSYREAVRFNPALLASWNAILELAGDDASLADEAQQNISRLSALPKELLSVRSMISEGKLLKAEALCRAFMKQNPKHVEGMRLLADLAVRFDILDDAEFLLESALEFEPDNLFARFDYVNVLYRRQKYQQSLAEARRLVELRSDNDSYQAAYANQLVAVGEYTDAIDIYNRLLDRQPNANMLHLLKGHALKTTGNLEAAIDAYHSAYASRPDFGDAYWSLANLKTYRFSDEEIATLEKLSFDESIHGSDRVHANFALGKAFEDDKNFASSFKHYEIGNRLKKEALHYDSEQMTTSLKLQQESCIDTLFAAHRDTGCQSPDPIFIVGMPRAGSTLLEQILASHSKVDGTFELPNIGALAHRLNGRRTRDQEHRYPRCLTTLDAKDLDAFGQRYIEETMIHRDGRPFFIDKMPNNFRHIGLIHLILPNAKIIDARRHPMACCFSGFKQLFASGQEFSYGLREIGQYYTDYVDLMDHWDSVLPGRVLRVNYEHVVSDLEHQVRRILDYCELPFEDACIEFHKTSRSIRTPSSEQVRQPIYRSGLEQWRNFSPWLVPLEDALGPNVNRYTNELVGGG